MNHNETQTPQNRENLLREKIAEAKRYQDTGDFIRSTDAFTEVLDLMRETSKVDPDVLNYVYQALASDIFNRLSMDSSFKEALSLLRQAMKKAYETKDASREYVMIAENLIASQRYKLLVGQVKSMLVMGELRKTYEITRTLLSEDPDNQEFQYLFESALRAYRTTQDESAFKRIQWTEDALENGSYSTAKTYISEALALEMLSTEVLATLEQFEAKLPEIEKAAERLSQTRESAEMLSARGQLNPASEILVVLLQDESLQVATYEYRKAFELLNLLKWQIARRRLKVFLCHAKDDIERVRQLYKRLRSDGVDPWLDEEDLLSGQDWELEIRKTLRSADAVIICLSASAVDKIGFVQKEIKLALDVADEQPEGSIFIVPLKLEECSVPESLNKWHWNNYFEAEGYDRLLKTLRSRANKVGALL